MMKIVKYNRTARAVLDFIYLVKCPSEHLTELGALESFIQFMDSPTNDKSEENIIEQTEEEEK